MTDWTPISPGDPSWVPAVVETANTSAAESAAAAAASEAVATAKATAAASSASDAQGYASNAASSATAAATSETNATAVLATAVKLDGSNTPTANLPMGGFRHTGVGAATARTQYVDVAGLQDGSYTWVDGGGTADAITATYAPALTALVDGQECRVRATAANTTTTPTFSPNGITARTIVKSGGAALSIGDISGDGYELILRYNLANTRWELLNPAPAFALAVSTPDALSASAVNDGATVADTAIRDAVTDALDSAGTSSAWSDDVFRRSIRLNAGAYLSNTTNPLGGDLPTDPTFGLDVGGAGMLATVLLYEPTSAGGAAFDTSKIGYSRFHDFGLYSNDSANDAFDINSPSNGVGGNRFENIALTGSWQYAWDLSGTNNNDNNCFNNCLIYGAFTAAFHIGSGESMQHVNHWFNNTRMYLPNGCAVDVSKGGSIHFTNWTADSPGSSVASTIFKLNQSTLDAYNGQFNFSADFGRSEIAVSGQKLITCSWPAGNVTFRNLDMSGSSSLSMSGTQEVATYTLSKGGAGIGYYNSFLAGVHDLIAPSNPQYYQFSAAVRDCQHVSSENIFQDDPFKITPQSGETATAFLPHWELENVRGVPGNFENVALRVASTAYSVGDLIRTDDGYVYFVSSAGTSSSATTLRPGRSSSIADGFGAFILDQYPVGIYAKDANVKASGAIPLGTVRECMAILTASDSALPARIDSSTANGDAKIILPPQAKVFSLEFRLPAGVSSQSTTGTWKVRNDKFSPTTLATFAVSDPSSGSTVDTPVAYDVGAAAAVGQDGFGSRILVLEAQDDVTEEVSGGYVIIRYF